MKKKSKASQTPKEQPRTPTPADNEPSRASRNGFDTPRAPGFAQAFKPGEKDYDENPVRPKGFKE